MINQRKIIPWRLGSLSKVVQGQVFYSYCMQKKEYSFVYNTSFSKSVKLFPSVCFYYLKFHVIHQNQPLFSEFLSQAAAN